jgi:hypothetical protein
MRASYSGSGRLPPPLAVVRPNRQCRPVLGRSRYSRLDLSVSSSSDLSYRLTRCILYDFDSEGLRDRRRVSGMTLRPMSTCTVITKAGKEFLGAFRTKAVGKLGF